MSDGRTASGRREDCECATGGLRVSDGRTASGRREDCECPTGGLRVSDGRPASVRREACECPTGGLRVSDGRTASVRPSRRDVPVSGQRMSTLGSLLHGRYCSIHSVITTSVYRQRRLHAHAVAPFMLHCMCTSTSLSEVSDTIVPHEKTLRWPRRMHSW